MTVTVSPDFREEDAPDLLVAPLPAGHVLPEALAEPAGAAGRQAAEDFDGAADASLLAYTGAGAAPRVAFVGLGAPEAVDAECLRRAAAQGAEAAPPCKAAAVALHVPELFVSDVGSDGAAPHVPPAEAAQALVEGFLLAAYRFTEYKTDGEDDGDKDCGSAPERLRLHVPGGAAGNAALDALQEGAERGRVVAEAVSTARDLVNRSPHDKTATLLAQDIAARGAEHGFGVEVWNRKRIEAERMGGLLAVNRGSEEPPTFSILTWRPEGAVNERPVVLVGKGVVFDTGGLSLKPTKGSMDQMKADMAGAAAVVGAFEAIARLRLPVHVVGLVPATDNRPGRNAYVPGDVIHMHDGSTVEVLNTDAEGRLLLADALSYARRYEPALVIDVATPTGAQVVALGAEAAAVMTAEGDGAEARLAAMRRAGRVSGDRVHPLPLYADYAELLESDVADVKNVGGRAAGAVTAGKFLERFAGGYPWLHLDIAGPAFLQSAKPYRPAGGTGFGVRLLVAFLRAYAAEDEGGAGVAAADEITVSGQP